MNESSIASMPLEKAIRNRRSVRGFLSKPVTDVVIRKASSWPSYHLQIATFNLGGYLSLLENHAIVFRSKFTTWLPRENQPTKIFLTLRHLTVSTETDKWNVA